MGVWIVEKAIGGNVIRLQANRSMTNGGALSTEAEPTDKPPPKVVYGYCKVAEGDTVRAAILKEDLQVFCHSNGFMLSTVFTDWGVDDTAVVRPGFSSLLDVCQLVGSYGVVVPSRMHLSAHEPTLEMLTRQIRRTGVKLVAVDEVTAAGLSGAEPDKGRPKGGKVQDNVSSTAREEP
jgi:hypothetical protein